MGKKKKDEHVMDNSFLLEDKSNHSLIIVLIIIILLLGLLYYLYNEYTDPKKIYLNIYNNLSEVLYLDKYKDKIISYNTSLVINSGNEKYDDIIDILNNLSISGNMVFNNEESTNDMNIFNKSRKLLNIKGKKLENEYYLELKEIYPKVIKLDNITLEDNNITKLLDKMIDSSKYERKIEKNNNKYRIVSLMNIDSELKDMIISNLIENDKFMELYSNINSESVSFAVDKLNDIKNNNLDIKLQVYSNLFTRKFIKLEIILGDINFNIIKDKDKYSFEYIDNYNLKYEGMIEKRVINNKDNIKVVIKSVDDKTSLEGYLSYEIIDGKLQKMDTDDYINYEDIKKEEKNNIANNLLDIVKDTIDDRNGEDISYLREISFNELKNKLDNKDSFILLVSQTRCSHCINYKPKLESVINKYKIEVLYIEIDLLNDTEYSQFDELIYVEGTPTTVFINNGEEDKEKRIVGSLSEKEIYEKLKKYGYIKE